MKTWPFGSFSIVYTNQKLISLQKKNFFPLNTPNKDPKQK